MSNRKVKSVRLHVGLGMGVLTGTTLETRTGLNITVNDNGVFVESVDNKVIPTLIPFSNVIGVFFEQETKSESSKDSGKASR